MDYIIYKITNLDDGKPYVGSTTKTLKERIAKHKRDANYGRKNGCGLCACHYFNWDNVKVEKLETPDIVIDDRLIREKYHWMNTPNCVNKNSPIRTEEETRERKKQKYQNDKEAILEKGKQYRQDNREAISERKKQYRQNNKEAISKQKKQYHQDNKEAISERDRQKYQNNKEAILEQKKQKITCECGSIVRKSDLARHKKSNKHQNFSNNNLSDN